MELHNRRVFLRVAAAAGAAWATADLVQVRGALAWAAEQSAAGAPATSVLTSAQAAVVDAMAARILPSVNGRPGAHEAGAVYFIDRALATFNAAQKKAYADGIADLDRRAKRKSPGQEFAALAPAQQDAVLRDIEKSPFFQAVRFDVIVGTFGLPAIGANRDHAGWQMIGLDHQPRFQAPFGYYDADANRRS